MDLRGHGKSLTDNELDLSTETLCNDVIAVIKAIMGGSVAVHVAAKKAISSLAGLVVVDVVEGTAMASLIHMQKILLNRVQFFPSIERAIESNVKGGSVRNVESARVSIPSTLIYDESKKCYVYRARLQETEQYWRGWYEGLSEKFLSCPVPKLLLLAGTDRLDRPLTIGQMQGKFQMIVVRHTGHAIQEDVPEEFASLILNFISRNRIGPNGVEGGGGRTADFDDWEMLLSEAEEEIQDGGVAAEAEALMMLRLDHFSVDNRMEYSRVGESSVGAEFNGVHEVENISVVTENSLDQMDMIENMSEEIGSGNGLEWLAANGWSVYNEEEVAYDEEENKRLAG
ncbi:unnamed protein product [Rhodiola kirilowii]